MSQGRDSPADTTWREGDAAPAPAACPDRSDGAQAAQPARCFGTMLLRHQPLRWPTSSQLRSQGDNLLRSGGTPVLQPRPGAPTATQAVGDMLLQCLTLYE